jgi:hypothetical protein
MIVAPGLGEKGKFSIPPLLGLDQPFTAFRRENLFGNNWFIKDIE